MSNPQTIESENWTHVESHDEYGAWTFVIAGKKDRNIQLRIESGTGDEAFINCDKVELKAICDAIQKQIKSMK